MAYNAENLTPDDYVLYRLMRYGEAGRFGNKGAKLAGRRHGVSARAWLYYESGHRQPNKTQRRDIAKWLNVNARSEEERIGTYVDVEPSPPPPSDQ